MLTSCRGMFFEIHMKRKIPILSRLLFLIRYSPWLWCDHLHICSKSLNYCSRVKYCNDAFKNTLTNVTCETLYRLHTPRPTWFGALKKKKKCSSKPPAAIEELACKAFAGEIKRRLFSTPSSLQEHTFCVLCLTKEFPNFGGEGGKAW